MRELRIDWHALHSAFQMNMPEVHCFFDVNTAEVLKLAAADPHMAAVRADPKRYAPIDAVPSRIQYQWLDEFVRTVEDEDIKERMQAAINGKGAFRRFKDILLTLPDERRRWFEFRDEMMRRRIVDWVRELGIEPQNEPPWLEEPGAVKKAEPVNTREDVEALRDFIIDWVDEKRPEEVVAPINLERLAVAIAESFRVKPVK